MPHTCHPRQYPTKQYRVDQRFVRATGRSSQLAPRDVRLALAARRVLEFLACVLGLAFGLVDFAFAFQATVAGRLADRFLGLALRPLQVVLGSVGCSHCRLPGSVDFPGPETVARSSDSAIARRSDRG